VPAAGPAHVGHRYSSATGARGDVHADGSGSRLAGAGFIAYAIPLSSRVRLSIGARADWLSDRYDADVPEPTSHDATHSTLSPRAGVNVRYIERERTAGNAGINVSRSFKAPTLDQLFDQRRFPVPFPPFEIGFANTDLAPQYGTNIEAGLYHTAVVIPGRLDAALSLAAYQMNLRDELDFDIETLSYRNLRSSRHRGVETSLDVIVGPAVSGWARYTRQEAINREGDNEGVQLKAIPRHLFSAGVRTNPAPGLQASVTSLRVWGTHIDDANTIELPGWTRWDARIGIETSAFSVWVSANNLFDAEYSTTGYPDAADPGTLYFYPAAGRTLEIGISRAW
jgi:outer membrane receptor protein involved in Fe transport